MLRAQKIHYTLYTKGNNCKKILGGGWGMTANCRYSSMGMLWVQYVSHNGKHSHSFRDTILCIYHNPFSL